MSETGFGKPKYTANSNYVKNIKLKDGGNVVRIIPPIKSCAETGEWYVFEKRHFGYSLPNSSNGESPIPAPFRCIEESNRDGLITKECAECKKIRLNKERLDARTYETRDMPPEKVEPMLKPLKAFAKDHNIDKKYWVNAKTESGEFGLLPLPYSVYKALRKKMDTVIQEEGIDPIAAEEGCYFNIIRSGKGLNTEYEVEVVQQKTELPDGRKVTEIKKAPLSQADFEACMRNCGDLKSDCVRVLTADQIKALSECSGDPDDVAAIINVSRRRESSSERSPASKPAPKAEPKPEPEVEKLERTPDYVAVAPPVTPPAAAPVDDEEAEMLRKLEEIRKKKAAAAAPPPPQTEPAPAAPAATGFGKAATPMNMSDDDFLKMFPDPTK